MPFDALPNVLDPAEGFIVTANQAVTGRTTPTSSPTTGTTATAASGSASCSRREGELSVDDMADLQLDTRNPIAPVLVPYLMRHRPAAGYYRDGQRLLRDWDFTQPADSAAAAYFNVVWRNLLRADLPRRAAASRCGRTAATAGSRW